jgi:hypothetical protein
MFTPGFDGSEGGLEWNDRMAIVQVSIDMIRIKPDLPPDIAACVDILTGFPMTERQRFIDAFAACP